MSNIAKELAKEESSMDMTPMIDVTFQLLIFFMCSLNFKIEEGMLMSHLPKDQGVFSVAVKSNPYEQIRIQLIKSGPDTVVLADSYKFSESDKYQRLYQHIQSVLSKLAESGGKESTISVVIEPEIDVGFQDVISTLNVCRKIQTGGAWKNLEVKFSAKALEEKE